MLCRTLLHRTAVEIQHNTFQGKISNSCCKNSHSFVRRLTNQEGLDLVDAIVPQVLDEFTQIVVLVTGDSMYENSFRYNENTYKGRFSACINTGFHYDIMISTAPSRQITFA